MKLKSRMLELLRWITCIGSYWVCIALYPHNFYYRGVYLPAMDATQVLVLFGSTALFATVLYFLLKGLFFVFKRIGIQKNLVFYFLFHFVICTLFAFALDAFLPFFAISPWELYLLIGFFPAMLYSALYSYQHSQSRREK